MKIFITALLIGISLHALAQNKGQLSTTIVNDKQAPAENSTVELLKAKDSALVKAALTGKDGKAIFENILFGEYIIKATLVNCAPQYSAAFSLSSASMEAPELVLQAASKENKENLLVAFVALWEIISSGFQTIMLVVSMAV